MEVDEVSIDDNLSTVILSACIDWTGTEYLREGESQGGPGNSAIQNRVTVFRTQNGDLGVSDTEGTQVETC